MKKRLFTIVCLIMVAMCSVTLSAQTHGINRADMDLTVNPGDDFFQYSGGGWMKANPLTPEYASYGVFNELAEKNRNQLKELFDNLANEPHAPGSVGQKVTDLFALAMDSTRLNNEGAGPLRRDLDWARSFTKQELTPYIAHAHMNLGNPFFGIGVDPLGYSCAESKVVEAKEAIKDGAEEIDTVVNVSDVKNHRYDEVKKELQMIREACGDKLLKVIIETSYLTEEEKIELCKIVTEVKADYIKTSTGFGTAGATLEDIELFKKHIGPDVKIKAAGGIRTIEDAKAYAEAGCSRIGSSKVAPQIAEKYGL